VLPLTILVFFLSCHLHSSSFLQAYCFVSPYFLLCDITQVDCCFCCFYPACFILPAHRLVVPLHLHNCFLFPAACVTSTDGHKVRYIFPAIIHTGWLLLLLFVLPIVHVCVFSLFSWLFSSFCFFGGLPPSGQPTQGSLFCKVTVVFVAVTSCCLCNCWFYFSLDDARLFCLLLHSTQVGCWFWYCFFLPLVPFLFLVFLSATCTSFFLMYYCFFVLPALAPPLLTHARVFPLHIPQGSCCFFLWLADFLFLLLFLPLLPLVLLAGLLFLWFCLMPHIFLPLHTGWLLFLVLFLPAACTPFSANLLFLCFSLPGLANTRFFSPALLWCFWKNLESKRSVSGKQQSISGFSRNIRHCFLLSVLYNI